MSQLINKCIVRAKKNNQGDQKIQIVSKHNRGNDLSGTKTVGYVPAS